MSTKKFVNKHDSSLKQNIYPHKINSIIQQWKNSPSEFKNEIEEKLKPQIVEQTPKENSPYLIYPNPKFTTKDIVKRNQLSSNERQKLEKEHFYKTNRTLGIDDVFGKTAMESKNPTPPNIIQSKERKKQIDDTNKLNYHDFMKEKEIDNNMFDVKKEEYINENQLSREIKNRVPNSNHLPTHKEERDINALDTNWGHTQKTKTLPTQISLDPIYNRAEKNDTIEIQKLHNNETKRSIKSILNMNLKNENLKSRPIQNDIEISERIPVKGAPRNNIRDVTRQHSMDKNFKPEIPTHIMKDENPEYPSIPALKPRIQHNELIDYENPAIRKQLNPNPRQQLLGSEKNKFTPQNPDNRSYEIDQTMNNKKEQEFLNEPEQLLKNQPKSLLHLMSDRQFQPTKPLYELLHTKEKNPINLEHKFRNVINEKTVREKQQERNNQLNLDNKFHIPAEELKLVMGSPLNKNKPTKQHSLPRLNRLIDGEQSIIKESTELETTEILSKENQRQLNNQEEELVVENIKKLDLINNAVSNKPEKERQISEFDNKFESTIKNETLINGKDMKERNQNSRVDPIGDRPLTTEVKKEDELNQNVKMIAMDLSKKERIFQDDKVNFVEDKGENLETINERPKTKLVEKPINFEEDTPTIEHEIKELPLQFHGLNKTNKLNYAALFNNKTKDFPSLAEENINLSMGTKIKK